jgi:hypothetical protein
LQTLPQIAQGDANKMWVVPSEFSKALEGLSKMGGGEDADAPSWLNVTGTGQSSNAPGQDTEGWFDSNLPPAAEQPEAEIVHGSDQDKDTLEAHSGLPTVPAMPKPPSISAIKHAAGTQLDQTSEPAPDAGGDKAPAHADEADGADGEPRN